MNYSDLVGWFVGVTFLAPNKHKDFSGYIRDLSYSTTDRKEIAYAINGYFEVAEITEGCKWEQEVRNHLALVFKKVTPSVTNEKKSLQDYINEKIDPAPRQPLWSGLYPYQWPVAPHYTLDNFRVIC